MVFRSAFLHDRPNFGRPGERQQVDIRMRAQSGARLFTQAGNNIDSTGREADFRSKLRKAQHA